MLPHASFADTHAYALDRALPSSTISRIPAVGRRETRPGSHNTPCHDPSYCRLGWTSMSERICLCACFRFCLFVCTCACACVRAHARVHLRAQRNSMAYVACDQLHATYTHACTHTQQSAMGGGLYGSQGGYTRSPPGSGGLYGSQGGYSRDQRQHVGGSLYSTFGGDRQGVYDLYGR